MTANHRDILAGLALRLDRGGPAADWAGRLLAGLGADVAAGASSRLGETATPAQRWAASGAMALTGYADGPGLLPPVEVATAADGAALAFEALAGLFSSHPADRSAVSGSPGAGSGSLDRSYLLGGAGLLGERAALLGLGRNGTTTPGSSSRLLPARDGWVALGLRRTDDFDLLPALIGAELRTPDAPWPAVADWLAGQSAQDAVDRAQLLGLPAATPGDGLDRPESPWHIVDLGPTEVKDLRRRPLVVDFSTLWAGPLATSLLAAVGADVIKVESPRRPDGSRSGPDGFNDLMNGGKLSVAADPTDRLVRELIDRADLVVTSARPRALEQLGLIPRPGRSWLTITGYGWSGPRRNWVAYGDDAAVAAGLLAGPAHAPVFCADAIADPLTGLHAAVAAAAALIGKRPVHVDISLYGVSRYLRSTLPVSADEPIGRPAAPHARPIREKAHVLGADQDHPLVRGTP